MKSWDEKELLAFKERMKTDPPDSIALIVHRLTREIYGQREEILKAFIAKYGCEPDEVEQVEQRSPMGFSRWFVRKRSKEQIERDNQLGED